MVAGYAPLYYVRELCQQWISGKWIRGKSTGGQAVRQFVAFGYVVTGPERGCVFFLSRGGQVYCIKPSYDEPL